MENDLSVVPKKRFARPWRTAFQFALVLLIMVSLGNYQYFLDEYALATYHAPADIAALETPLGLTRTAQAIADRAQPQIDEKAAFNRDCQTSVGELELGCYTHGRIYILKISSPSLQPEMETVLAHEILHAAWNRMSTVDRLKLGNELETRYHELKDTELTSRMASYAKTEPGEEANELHSILGTEQTNLANSDLESHYLSYFTNRAAIVAAHQDYQAVFTSRGRELAQQLATIKSLEAQLDVLNARMTSDNTRGLISAYNALVPSQNRLVDQVNGLIRSYDASVDEYNALSASIDSNQLSTEPGV
ncbi:hypothetical protein HJC99_02490 [Candidatus Saccharibacteria bacterium]|nr:hypothetical protein [Candidatus Saccharibacteria bacterium]